MLVWHRQHQIKQPIHLFLYGSYSTNVPLYQTSSSYLTSTRWSILILDCLSTERLFYSLGCTYYGIKYPCCTKENFYAKAASLTKADVYAKAALLY